MLTGILVGLLPALRSTSVSLIAAMKSRQMAGSERHSRFHPGKWIVAGQVALSLVLLIGGGLLLHTFVKLLTLDAGFDRHNVLVVAARAPWFAADAVTMAPEQRAAAYDEIGRRLEAIPGVISVARSFTTPIGSDNYMHRHFRGCPERACRQTGTRLLQLCHARIFHDVAHAAAGRP